MDAEVGNEGIGDSGIDCREIEETKEARGEELLWKAFKIEDLLLGVASTSFIWISVGVNGVEGVMISG